MTRELAKKVSQDLLSCSGKLDESVALIQEFVKDDFLRTYRRHVGKVMGLLYIEVLRDLYAEHPDLEPESMRT